MKIHRINFNIDYNILKSDHIKLEKMWKNKSYSISDLHNLDQLYNKYSRYNHNYLNYDLNCIILINKILKLIKKIKIEKESYRYIIKKKSIN